MAITEVFPNPTVKSVHFEIRFPNLFYIEKKIGDFQIKIMKQFPESALLLRRQLFLADLGQDGKILQAPEELESEAVKKIWNFKSGTGIEVSVLSNSLQIHSSCHKTYNNPASPNRFRDIIKLVLDSFIDVTSIPIISRLGLRYIDECPIVRKDNYTFRDWFNTSFPLDRFDISDAIKMSFKTTVKRGNYFLRYMEELKSDSERNILALDFDGFVESIEPVGYLEVADNLHALISDEYQKSIKNPVYDYMKREP